MADNHSIAHGAGPTIAATREVTYSGDTTHVPVVGLVTFAGSDDAKTVTDVGAGAGLPLAGDVAHDAVDSGNPVKIGGKANSSAPSAVAAGDRVDAWYDPAGRAVVAGSDALGTPGGILSVQGASADFGATSPAPVAIGGWDPNNSRTRVLPALGATLGVEAPAVNFAGVQPLVMASVPYLRGQVGDGNTLVQEHGNVDVTVLASAARTAAVTGSDITNHNGAGVAHIVLDVTADPAAASITVTIQGKDSLSGKYYDILVGAAVAAVGTTVYRIDPRITAVANSIAQDSLPRVWRVNVAVADADSMTYSIGASVK